MRCIGCDKLLTDPEIRAKNKNTGLHEDRCKECKPIDTGVIYNRNQSTPVGFFNPALLERQYVGGPSASSEENGL